MKELDKDGVTTSVIMGSKKEPNPSIFGSPLGVSILKGDNTFLNRFRGFCCKFPYIILY